MVPCTSGTVVGKGLRLPHVNVHNICNSASRHLGALCVYLNWLAREGGMGAHSTYVFNYHLVL